MSKPNLTTVKVNDPDAFKKIAETIKLTPEQLQAILVKVMQDKGKREAGQ